MYALKSRYSLRSSKDDTNIMGKKKSRIEEFTRSSKSIKVKKCPNELTTENIAAGLMHSKIFNNGEIFALKTSSSSPSRSIRRSWNWCTKSIPSENQLGCAKSVNVYSLQSTKKKEHSYSLRSRKEKNSPEKLLAENILNSSRKVSDKMKYRERELYKSHIKTRDDSDSKGKLKLKLKGCDKLRETMKTTFGVLPNFVFASDTSSLLSSHSIRCISEQCINCNQGESVLNENQLNCSKSENIIPRYSLRPHVQGNNQRSICVGSGMTREKHSLKSTKKEEHSYSLRSRKEITPKKLLHDNILDISRKVSYKLKYKENSLYKSNTNTRDDCDIKRKLKLKQKGCDKLQETLKTKLGGTKQPRKHVTEKKNICASKSKNALKLKKGLENGIAENDSGNDSFNEKVLISYKKYPQSETVKRNVGKNCKVPFHRRSSFEKYGVLFPSYEKVLDNINKIREEANALDAYEVECGNHDNSLPLILKNNNNSETHEEQNLLDCKHLSGEKLKQYFHLNLDYTKNILNGKLTSQRHERYKNYDPKTHLTMDDLTYSPSIIVFTSNQRDLLLKLLEDEFDPDSQKTEYLFKVLLPEICLKIFMDVYAMTVDDAVDYLNWRPLD